MDFRKGPVRRQADHFEFAAISEPTKTPPLSGLLSYQTVGANLHMQLMHWERIAPTGIEVKEERQTSMTSSDRNRLPPHLLLDPRKE